MDSDASSPIDQVVHTGHAREAETSPATKPASRRARKALEPAPEVVSAETESERPSGVLARALGAMREQNGAVHVDTK